MSHPAQHRLALVNAPLPDHLKDRVRRAKGTGIGAVERLELDQHLAIYRRPQPEFTCPLCRSRVFTPPVELYNLKKLIRATSDVAIMVPGSLRPEELQTTLGQWARYFEGRLDVR